MVIFLSIFFILFVLYGLLINYYRRSWNAIPDFRPDSAGAIKISVVVAARNEEENILFLLDALSKQDYPMNLFEVIIVNDHSTDRTSSLIKEYKNENLQLFTIDLEEGINGKKKAIAVGIERSTGELIVTTDADCTMNENWLITISNFYQSTNAKFIAAPVLIKPFNSLLGIFQTLDFLTLQGITGASVFRKFHTMCNGANLAYPKNVFEEVNGFEGIDNIPSGDDMLLMHKIFEIYPDDIHYLKNKNALVTTLPEKSWKLFFQQRIRWASKAVHYKDKRIFYVLVLTYLINVCFLISGIAAFTGWNWFMMFLIFLSAKIIIEFPFVNAVAIYFGTRKQLIWFPFLQPVHIIYILVSGWLGRFGSYNWKLRTIKTVSAKVSRQDAKKTPRR